MATRWEKKEVNFLMENWFKLKPKEIAHQLKKTEGAILKKATSIGLYKRKAKMVGYHPDTIPLIKEFWEKELGQIKFLQDKLLKWVEKLEIKHDSGGKGITNRDIIALAKALDSLSNSTTEIAKYLKIIEKSVTNIEHQTVNLNMYGFYQTVNEVLDPEQRVQFEKKLREKGLIKEIMVR